MIAFIVDIFSNLVGWLTGVLPQSPFSDLTLAEDVHNMLGLLNWFVPIGDMLALFSTVLALYVLARGAVFLVNRGISLADLASGR